MSVCPSCGATLSSPEGECPCCHQNDQGQGDLYKPSDAVVGLEPPSMALGGTLPSKGAYGMYFGISDVISGAFRFYGKNFAALLLFGLVQLGLNLGSSLLGGLTAGLLYGLSESWIPVLLTGLVVFFAWLFLMSATVAAMFVLLDSRVREGAPALTVGEAYGMGFRCAPRVVVANLVLIVLFTAIAIPATLAFLSGSFSAGLILAAPTAPLWLLVGARTIAVLPSISIEDRGAFDGFSRSLRLTAGYSLPLMGILVLFGLIMIGISIVVAVFSLIPFLGWVVQMGAQAFIVPLYTTLPFSSYAGLAEAEA